MVLATCSRAWAQPVPLAPTAAPSADDAKEAKRHFTVGNDLYRDGRFQEAVVEFDASYRLGARPSALRNAADCRRQLNEYADAYDAYQVLLARHRSQLGAADQAAVQKAIDELDALTGLLSVNADEDGAEIVVDDRVVARTPLATRLRLSLGHHKVAVRKAGFVSFEAADLALISKQTVTVEAKLVREVVTGHLSVREANRRDVNVFVDDADKGPAPWEGDLEPGPHVVMAKGARFAAEQKLVVVVKGSHLVEVLRAEPTTCRLLIRASPAGAVIELDHREVGEVSWDGEVAPGPHHIEVAVGQVRAMRDVTVARGATETVEIPLAVDQVQEQAAERDRSEARSRLRVVFSVEVGMGIWNMDMGNIPVQLQVVDPSHTELNDFGGVVGGALSVRYQLGNVWALQARLNGQALIGSPNPQGLDSSVQQQVSGTPTHFGLDLTGRWVPGRFFIGLGPSLHVWSANGSDTVTSGGQTYTIEFPVEWGIGDTFELGYLIGTREEGEVVLRSQTAWAPHGMPVSATLALGYALR